MVYEDIVLLLTEAPVDPDSPQLARLRVQVTQSPGCGEIAAGVASVCDVSKVRGLLAWSPGRLPPAGAALIQAGELLADALLPDEVRGLLLRSLDAVRSRGHGLRIRLMLSGRIQSLPLESLVLKRTAGEATQLDCAALMPDVSIVRHDAATLQNQPVRAGVSLRILGATANPHGSDRLDLQAEKDSLHRALEARTDVVVSWIEHATPQGLFASTEPAHIFHFIGHGDFEEEPQADGAGAVPPAQTPTSGAAALGPVRDMMKKGKTAFKDAPGRGVVLLEDGASGSVAISAERLGLHLRDRGVRVAVLSACKTAHRDEIHVWSSLAAGLLKADLGAVVGMQYSIFDDSAIAFSGAFYEALAAGLPLDEAVSLGRRKIAKQDDFGWVTPVLHLRVTEAVVFTPIPPLVYRFLPVGVPDFTGREWVLEKINGWLADKSDARYFLITGEPGSGKSTIAARLWDASCERVAAPKGMDDLGPGFLSAAHSCTSRDTTSIAPRDFARAISLQLAARHLSFRSALSGSGETAEAVIDKAVLNAGSEESVFHRLVRDPLARIYAAGFAEPITILVDALDQALLPGGQTSIIDLLAGLDALPSQVRFVITTREDSRVLNELRGHDSLSLSAVENGGQNLRDVRQYVSDRLAGDATLFAKLPAEMKTEELTDSLAQAGAGNFLYVRFLLNQVSRTDGSFSALNSLPDGLDLLYYESLDRLVKLGQKDWAQVYAPILGTLAVAKEPLDLKALARFTGLKESVASSALDDLEQYTEREPAPKGSKSGEARYRLYHQSVVDFVRKTEIRSQGRARKNNRWISTGEWHERIARSYLTRSGYASWDEYGLRYTAEHLAAAAAESEQPERHELVGALVHLMDDGAFHAAHTQRLDDPLVLQADLERAVRAAVTDDDPAGLPSLLRAVASFLEFRKLRLDPGRPFALARKGQVAAAARCIDLFHVDAEWMQVILLLLAWRAAEVAPQEARELRDRAASLASGGSDAIRLLLTRVDAAIEKKKETLPPLPPPPDEYEVRDFVLRTAAALSGEQESLWVSSSADSEGMVGNAGRFLSREHALISLRTMAEGLEHASANFLALYDGPPLVSFAVSHPEPGQALLAKYLQAHADYRYVHYRNGALMALLQAVLCHPEPGWACDTAEKMARIALMETTAEEPQSLSLTVHALQVRAGIATTSAQAFVDLSELDGVISGMTSGREGDPWGKTKRRIAAVAEALCIFARDSSLPVNLIGRAVSLPYGFAGFQVPAYLRLAEAAEICNAHMLAEPFLRAACAGAHNVRDSVLCGRLTARANAMQLRWWAHGSTRHPTPLVIRRFLEDPGAPEFLPIHQIGDSYYERMAGAPLGPLRQARTLRDLAECIKRPLADLERCNPNVGADAELDIEHPVSVPDPGFRTVLASRFSAALVAHPSISPDERMALLRALIPLALGSPADVDTVLSRLLMVAQGISPVDLDRLAEQAARIVPPESSGWSAPS